MKKAFFLLFLSSSVFAAQAPIYVAPPTTMTTPAPAKKKTTTTPGEAESAAIVTAKSGAAKSSNEIMIISPDMRAKDIQSAIQYLRQHVPTSKPTIKLIDGSTIKNIMNVDVMPGGTILIFKISSLKGMLYKVVNIEDIGSLSE